MGGAGQLSEQQPNSKSEDRKSEDVPAAGQQHGERKHRIKLHFEADAPVGNGEDCAVLGDDAEQKRNMGQDVSGGNYAGTAIVDIEQEFE
jgi:hypothetical protein